MNTAHERRENVFDYALIPPNTIKAINDFVEYGLKPGGFTQAVLSNDLRDACARADSENRHVLFEIVLYCTNEIPNRAWGSRENVDAWIEMFARKAHHLSLDRKGEGN